MLGILGGKNCRYCLSFLANVTAKDAAEWLESCAMTLLQELG